MVDKRTNHREDVAEEIIRAIEDGTAPWVKPWRAGEIGTAPFNPVTGKQYRGINSLFLSLKDRTDPRWMTYQQALDAGGQVRKGERSTRIEYWQWSERVPLLDAEGRPSLDPNGEPVHVERRLERPRVFYANVFNAERIDGLAPWVAPAPSFDPIERAEAIMTGGGVAVHHDQADRAFYRPATDEIHLPPRSAFHNAEGYYATALHELGHATGHQSRLAREGGPFGSELYAREELRAEIASYMLARDLGVSHEPGQHAAYVGSWIKVLSEDPNEIFRAARDAEIAKTWILEPERRPELERAAQQRLVAKTTEERGMTNEPPAEAPARERTYIAVPFAEKDEAKSLGAKWDRVQKSWFVPAGTDPAPFDKWKLGAEPAPVVAADPKVEFAAFLESRGLALGGAPVMDGEWHRVAVNDDKKGVLSGSYRGFLDGVPNGQVTNYKAGIVAERWVAAGVAMTPEALETARAEAARAHERREAARREAETRAAKVAYGVWANLDGREEDCAYLQTKGVTGHGVRVDKDGNLVVPARDADGRLSTVQIIRDGEKRYIADGRKKGTMHVVEPTGAGTLAAAAGPGPIVIAEGYATAATIHEATGYPVVVAFDSGNLELVARAVRDKFPSREIVIAADNDHANKNGNVGVEKAAAAAAAVGAVVAIPEFSDMEKTAGLTDFNDLGGSRGPEAVKRGIESVRAKKREAELELAR